MMRNKKIVMGICGIGRGHSIRQLPVINALSEANKLMLFVFGESYDFYAEKFANNPNVRITKVVVPRFVGYKDGIDFEATAKIAANDTSNYFAVNMSAFQEVRDWLGKPDLAISDYEPTVAQLSYSLDVPLLTLDQQSKYLYGDYPILYGNTALSEKARLEMFLPKAAKRVACSFFKLPHLQDSEVELVPPILKESLITLRDSDIETNGRDILVYLSPYSQFVQPEAEVMDILAGFPAYQFHLYASRQTVYGDFANKQKNVSIYYHGDPSFEDTMKKMVGAISTAGHSFLSEAMYLGKPVFAVPLDTYEQAYNAKIIADHNFGISDTKLTSENVNSFVSNLSQFSVAIAADTEVLQRQDGLPIVLSRIESMLS